MHFKIQNWLWGLGTEIAFSSFKADPSPSWNNTFAIQRGKQYFTFEERVLVNTNTNYLLMGWQVEKSTGLQTQQNKKKTQMFSFPAAEFKMHFSTNTYLVATLILPCVWLRSRAVNKANCPLPSWNLIYRCSLLIVLQASIVLILTVSLIFSLELSLSIQWVPHGLCLP